MGRGGADPQGQGADPVGVPAIPRGPDPVHLPPSGGRAPAHAGVAEVRHRRGRLRDGPAPRREPPAPDPDERGGRAALGPGGRVLPRQGPRRTRHPALGRPRRAARERDDHRRRHRRSERREDRGGAGRRRVGPRRERGPPPPRGRHLPRSGSDPGLERLQHRPPRPARRPPGRRRPGRWRPRPDAGPGRRREDDEGRLGDRRRGGRPGRLRRDDAPDDPGRAHLPRARRRALRGGQHTGSRAPHVDLRLDQRHPAVRRRAGGQGPEEGARRERGAGQGPQRVPGPDRPRRRGRVGRRDRRAAGELPRPRSGDPTGTPTT